MSPEFKKEYTEKFYLRYKKAKTKGQKSDLITELCIPCNWHRKHAIRKLSNFKRFIKPKLKKKANHQNIISLK